MSLLIYGLHLLLTLLTETHSTSIRHQILFEGSGALSGLNRETAHAHSMTLASSPVFQGSQSLRVELRDSDNEVAGGTRAELNLGHAQAREEWYSLAVHFPASYTADSHAEQILQWHSVPDEHLGEGWRGPAKSLQIQRGRFIMKIGYNTKQVSSNFEGEQIYDLGPVTTGAWHQFTFHVLHSHNPDGLVELWHNGRKVLEHKGGNSYNDVKLPFWKVGLYKWAWNGSGKTDVSQRVLFFDNIRIGNASATLQEMSGDNRYQKFKLIFIIFHLTFIHHISK
jgi:hypothetical protein